MNKVYKQNKFKKERETGPGIVALTFGSRDRSSRLDSKCSLQKKKDTSSGILLSLQERETGLEPAASTLARSRSTN